MHLKSTSNSLRGHKKLITVNVVPGRLKMINIRKETVERTGLKLHAKTHANASSLEVVRFK